MAYEIFCNKAHFNEGMDTELMNIICNLSDSGNRVRFYYENDSYVTGFLSINKGCSIKMPMISDPVITNAPLHLDGIVKVLLVKEKSREILYQKSDPQIEPEIYSIGNADNTKHICDIYEDSFNLFRDMGIIRMMTPYDTLNDVKGNECNYILFDDEDTHIILKKAIVFGLAENKEKINSIIDQLKAVGIDGETFDYITKELGFEDYMLHSLIMSKPIGDTASMLKEKIDVQMIK